LFKIVNISQRPIEAAADPAAATALGPADHSLDTPPAVP
jgi:hypothetical protein